MDKEVGGGLAALGLILLCLRFGGGLLPSGIRIIGNILVICGVLALNYGWGLALLVAGLLAIVTSVWTIIKDDWEITLYDGIVIAVGILETILAFVIGL